jgi:hypothetical protein
VEALTKQNGVRLLGKLKKKFKKKVKTDLPQSCQVQMIKNLDAVGAFSS